jgi:glycosyltransferase involved in cell wall biosynthesis
MYGITGISTLLRRWERSSLAQLTALKLSLPWRRSAKLLDAEDHIPQLFVGITSWNSERFLPRCIRAIQASTNAQTTEIVVLDNASRDASVKLARDLGATVVVEQCNQGEALNRLASLSSARYTLLIHADVIMLSPNWFALCRSKITDRSGLVSPEDIGCGPLTRPFGVEKPESSFLFFLTSVLKDLRSIRWQGRRWVKLPRRRIDFYGSAVTHNIPSELAKRGLSWFKMDVHWSEHVSKPIYTPDVRPMFWSSELAYLRYGLGNFYSIDGIITHYHNWYDRVQWPKAKRKEFPPQYIDVYTAAFLNDYDRGQLAIPPAIKSDRKPLALWVDNKAVEKFRRMNRQR